VNGVLFYTDVIHNNINKQSVVTVMSNIKTKWVRHERMMSVPFSSIVDCYDHLLVLNEDGEVWFLPDVGF
jgi:hypothetical protein